MDYPSAFKFVAGTNLVDHDPRCSYRVANRGMLCDCHIINDEYERRKKLMTPPTGPVLK
jgi:hypothetical protein